MLALAVTKFSILILVIGITLLHAGAFCIRIGHWPRRTGTDPFCGKCDYVLLGLESERCPECGQYLSSRTIVRGHRRRRGGVTFVGGVLVVVGMWLAVLSTSDFVRGMN
jgi:hypothetical protein